jgi:hypothetical protein
MTRRTFFLLGAGSAIGRAQTATAEQRGRRIVERALAALGGPRFLAMEDRVETGRAYSFYREELKGLSLAKIYTRYLPRPEPPVPGFAGVRERDVFGKKQDNYVLFTEADAWEVTFRGARPLPDERTRAYRDSTLRNIFYILRQRMTEPGLTFLSQGSDIFENRPVDIVEIGDAENRVVKVYFSQLNGLPVQQTFQRRNAVTREKDDEVTRYSKYRDVGGGAQWPFQIVRERNGEKIFELYSESVTVNANLTDDLFTLPVGVKMLKREK